MAEAEVIDLGVDPVAERRAARRRRRRVIAPIAAAGLLILSVIALVAAGYESNRRGALALSDDVLAGLEKRIELRAEQWLAAAERSLRLLHGVFADGPLAGAGREDAERLAISLLRHVPSIALVSLADTRGNYVLKRRNEVGGIDTKTIVNDPPPRTVTWVRRNADDTVASTEQDPTDQFDPRTRPWFTAAIAADRVVWTEPYIFFTDRVPGVTAAVAFRRAGELRAVFGVDIRLDALGEFLSRLEVGQRGQAIIIDRDGRIVAHPNPAMAMRDEGGTLRRPRLDELGDPVLARAYGLSRINGHGRFSVEIGEERMIIILSPMRAAGDGSWSILITAPESDFIGFVTRTGRITSGAGLLVIVLALALAALLIRQGLRADAMERTLERRTQAMAAQAQALSRLGRSPAVHDPTRDEGLELLTATLAETLRARRASFWRAAPAREGLICEDIYDRAAETHGHGMRLPRAAYPQLLAALARGEVFEVAEAEADPRTAELAPTLLAEAGARSLLCVPAMRGVVLAGALLVEDREASLVPLAEASGFALAIASIAVSRMTAAETARSAAQALAAGEARRAATSLSPPASLPAPPTATTLGDGLLSDRAEAVAGAPAAARPLNQPGLAAELFPAVTVLVLTLEEDAPLAAPVAEAGGPTLADRVVQLAQECAARHGIAYLRVMGPAVMLADGFGERAEAAPSVLAELALDLAERCAELFASLDLASAFRIGIDTGPAVGAAVGSVRRTYNLWGEAVRGAEVMAETAPLGTVQVSEAVHRRTEEQLLVRPRGRFWVAGSGEAATFLLASRA